MDLNFQGELGNIREDILALQDQKIEVHKVLMNRSYMLELLKAVSWKDASKVIQNPKVFGLPIEIDNNIEKYEVV